jgi:hypothetical protein
MPRRPRWYTLRDRIAVPCDDLHDAVLQGLDPASGRVAETVVAEGACWVSTVFLGLDHGDGEGEPMLFETMAFLPLPEDPASAGTPIGRRRYSSWADAEVGHAEVVAEVRAEYERALAVTTEALGRVAATGAAPAP